MSNDLLTLIEQYWNLAYAEGKEGRTHDTETGDAQRVLHQIKDAIAALEAAKLEAQPVGVPAGMREMLIRARAGLSNGLWDYGPGQSEHDQCDALIEEIDAMLVAAPSLPVEEKVQIEPVMGEMDEKTKMVTPYITQEQFDKTFPADHTAKVELQIVAWAHPDGGIIGDYQKEYNTYQFSKEYLAQHNIPLMFHPDAQAAIAAQGEKK